MVRAHPDPPGFKGGLAQLGEHLLCKQGVVGSIPSSSTNELAIDKKSIKKEYQQSTVSVAAIVSNA